MRIMAKAKWTDAKGQYSSGRVLMMGPVKVGTAGFDGWVSKGDPLPYAAGCALPGLKKHLGNYASQAEAEARVWDVVKKWFKATLGEAND
jgi:hypothetical protein